MMATKHDGHKAYHDSHNNENVKTNGVHLRKCQIHGKFTFIPSSKNIFVAIIVEHPQSRQTRQLLLIQPVTSNISVGDILNGYQIMLVLSRTHADSTATVVIKAAWH